MRHVHIYIELSSFTVKRNDTRFSKIGQFQPESAHFPENFFKDCAFFLMDRDARILLKINDLSWSYLQKAFYIGVFIKKKEKLHHISVDVKKDICYIRHVRIRSQTGHLERLISPISGKRRFIHSPLLKMIGR